MLRRLLPLLLLALCLVGLGGCTWGSYKDSEREVHVGSFLKSTDIGKVDVTTQNGTKLGMEGYKSDASKAIDLAKSVVEAAK